VTTTQPGTGPAGTESTGTPAATESSPAADTAALFTRVYGQPPSGVWSSPGRVNLIGEHTDYNQGLVLPFAIDHRAGIGASLTQDGVVSVVSAQQDAVIHTQPIADLDPANATGQGWPAYLYAVVWVLTQHGHQVPGVRLALDSTVPSGAGLSSSAAIMCATALALSDLLDLGLSKEQIARTAQQAENDYTGVPVGLMDQMASATCTQGHVIFFDVRAQTVEQVPFDPGAEDLTVLILDTRVKHALNDGEYAKRRASCEQAAKELGVPSLRSIGEDQIPTLAATLSSDLLLRRARHVISENARVQHTVDLLRQGRIRDIGPLLVASHKSLRDDYEVSDPALDLAQHTAITNGALGARMTGGGFGGSVIALVKTPDADHVSTAVYKAFEADGRKPPVIRPAHPSPGARRDT
jgi:galactokinase